MNKPIVNRVANSSLITIDLAKYLPKNPIIELDISPFLYKGLMLKEQEFRTALKEYNWAQYEGKHLAVYCSTDAIIPQWAFMLIAAYATPIANSVGYGKKKSIEQKLLMQNIEQVELKQWEEAKVIIKGCGHASVTAEAYTKMASRLQPIVKSLMYGEACSTVPIFKAAK